MKKILLSTIVMVSMATAADTNSEIETLKAQMSTMMKKISELEAKKEAPVNIEAPKHKATTVKSHVPVLKFSGTHYLGGVSSKNGNGDRTNRFETRRNYLQVKAYMEENSKDYMRITLDTHDDNGQSKVWLKYAYLYLDNVLPNTGVELGQVHRPWIDYEEHNGWYYRSISKTLVETKYGGDLTNSADRGVDFKTKTPYFTSELGLLNGEGYHNQEDGKGLSKEWRLTGHLLGTGKEHTKKSLTYANLSFFGQQNKLSNKHGNQDLNWVGFHGVYNQPAFLLSAQYIKVSKGVASKQGEGYSFNGEYRFAKGWNSFARYDNFKMDDNSGERKRGIAGISYKYNKNVELIANYLGEKGSNLTHINKQDAVMLTAEVEW